jgi:hypothetical protein
MSIILYGLLIVQGILICLLLYCLLYTTIVSWWDRYTDARAERAKALSPEAQRYVDMLPND